VDQRQRNVLIALASIVGALAVTLLIVTIAGGGGHPTRPTNVASADTTAPADTTTAVSTTATTVNPLPVTSAETPAATAAPTTTTAAPAPVVSAAGAVLTAPSSPQSRPVGPGCATLADPGWTADCGVAHAKGGDLVWLIETGPGGTGWRAAVWGHTGGSSWREVLTVTDVEGSRFGHIKARVAGVSGDGFDEIVFGFGAVGTQQLLQVDVVDGSKTVVAHRDLPNGSARVTTGQLDGWAGRDTRAGQQWVHEVIRHTGGAWRLVSSTTVTRSSVPPSQL
jgi:hypothetical protein